MTYGDHGVVIPQASDFPSAKVQTNSSVIRDRQSIPREVWRTDVNVGWSDSRHEINREKRKQRPDTAPTAWTRRLEENASRGVDFNGQQDRRLSDAASKPRPKLDEDFGPCTTWLDHDSALDQVKGYGHNQLQPDTSSYPYHKQECHKNLSASDQFYLKVEGRANCADPGESPKRRKDPNFSDVFHRDMSGGNVEHREIPHRKKHTPRMFPPANVNWDDPNNEIRFSDRVADASEQGNLTKNETLRQKHLNSHLPAGSFSSTQPHADRSWT